MALFWHLHHRHFWYLGAGIQDKTGYDEADADIGQPESENGSHNKNAHGDERAEVKQIPRPVGDVPGHVHADGLPDKPQVGHIDQEEIEGIKDDGYGH